MIALTAVLIGSVVLAILAFRGYAHALYWRHRATRPVRGLRWPIER